LRSLHVDMHCKNYRFSRIFTIQHAKLHGRFYTKALCCRSRLAKDCEHATPWLANSNNKPLFHF
jgi:hypothetical protein